MEPWVFQQWLDTIEKTSNLEPPEVVNYREKTKGQIPNLKLHKIWVCEEEQHATYS